MALALVSDSGCFTPDALATPASRAIAALLGERLDRVERAYDRLGDRKDPEALHDFRVDLRRLRSLLRIYRGLREQREAELEFERNQRRNPADTIPKKP